LVAIQLSASSLGWGEGSISITSLEPTA